MQIFLVWIHNIISYILRSATLIILQACSGKGRDLFNNPPVMCFHRRLLSYPNKHHLFYIFYFMIPGTETEPWRCRRTDSRRGNHHSHHENILVILARHTWQKITCIVHWCVWVPLTKMEIQVLNTNHSRTFHNHVPFLETFLFPDTTKNIYNFTRMITTR